MYLQRLENDEWVVCDDEGFPQTEGHSIDQAAQILADMQSVVILPECIPPVPADPMLKSSQ